MVSVTADLHVVFDVDTGVKAYHTPISRETFEANFDLIGLVKAAMDERGSAYAFGIGRLTTVLELRRQDAKMCEALGAAPRATALENELTRLTMIVGPSADGYHARPVSECLADGSLTADAWSETLATVLFFTCNYWAIPTAKRKQMISLWDSAGLSSSTSLNATEYADSLKTSTQDAATPQT